MKDQYFTDRGIAYRTSDLIPGRATLVFVHGVSGSSSAWKPYEESLKGEFNVITYDQRGHGHSKRHLAYSDHHLKHFAEDLHALLSHVGEYPYVLIGHSFGVLVVLAFLEQWQKQVGGAVLISGDFYVGRHFVVKLLNLFLAPVPLLAHVPWQVRRRGRIDYSRFPGSGDWHLGRSFTDIWNTGVRVYLFCIRQSYARDFGGLLERIAIPSLIIHGTKDKIFGIENSVAMSQRIPGAHLETIEGADHIVVLNFPQKVIELVRDFAKTAI